MASNQKVQIVEVGLRDGLQNEAQVLNLSSRLSLAEKLSDAGLRRIELGAFVSPHWVPQMADSERLIRRALELQKKGRISKSTQFSALVPNLRGLEDAIQSGVREIAVFGAASESFSQKNINCSIAESLKKFKQVIDEAHRHKIKVRGYLSTAFGCPYEGSVKPAQVVKVAKKLMDLGIYELSIGDTIGAGDPKMVDQLLPKLVHAIDPKLLAMHFHDTRGLAITNIYRSLDYDIRVFDSSVGGLGGCPYAPGASGNVATEDVAFLLQRLGYKSGVDLEKLIKLNPWVEARIQHELPSRVGRAGI